MSIYDKFNSGFDILNGEIGILEEKGEYILSKYSLNNIENITDLKLELIRIRVEEKNKNSVLINFYDENKETYFYKQWFRNNSWVEIIDEIDKKKIRKRKLDNLDE
jgi:hypothetical protein